jgi:NTE family protein
MVEDARTLCKLNILIGPAGAQTRSGRRYEKKPLLFVSPTSRATLGETAMEVFASQSPRGSDVAQLLRRYELRLLGRALSGDGTRRGDLFSYLYFDRDFIDASIELGQQDAERHLARALPNQVPWTSQ